MKKGYDFSGYVTKNDIVCSDGVTIKQDAFAKNDGKQVPLVWQHDYATNSNVLGHIILHNVKDGVYGYGYFNDTPNAKDAKTQLQHGDINSMSIGAKDIKRRQPGNNVIHGNIYEVSLVLAPANAGALIDQILTHDDSDSEHIILHTGNRLVLQEDMPEEDVISHQENGDKAMPAKETEEVKTEEKEKTIEEIFDTLNTEQREAVEAVIGAVIEDDDTEDEDSAEVKQSAIEEGETTLKHNAFNNQTDAATVPNGTGFYASNGEAITHSDMSMMITAAAKGRANSLSQVVADVLTHNGVQEDTDTLLHAITNVEVLFPETKNTNGFRAYNPQGQNVDKIMGMFFKSPMSRIKNVIMDLTEDDARARGYIKGGEKLDSIEKVYYRETTPGTVMRRESFDRDDLIDIQENGIDVVAFQQQTQKIKLTEEIVRAALIGDGRARLNVDGKKNPDKIDEEHIRPIATDDDLYTIKITVTEWKLVVDSVMVALAAYDGSGSPTLFINPFDLQGLKTLKDTTGRYLFGPNQNSNTVPNDTNIASYFGCNEVVAYRKLPRGSFIIGNLNDYAFGSAKGGQITNFDFFDIDFNKMKYLTETRLSGAIQAAKSFIFGKVTSPEKFGDLTITAETTAKYEQFDKAGVKAVPTWLTDSATPVKDPDAGGSGK